MSAQGARIVCVGIGSRGDVQPICVLAKRLAEAGHDAKIISNDDYRGLIQAFGLDHVEAGVSLGQIFRSPEFERALANFSGASFQLIPSVFRYFRRIEQDIARMIRACADAIRGADLVVYTPLGFFAGMIAKQLGIPSVQVTFQPVFPNWRISSPINGGRDLGPVLNRLSYETSRPFAFFVRRALRLAYAGAGEPPPLGVFANPVTLSGRISRQIFAYSSLLAPDQGAAPRGSVTTGFWFRRPEPGQMMLPAISEFIEAGEPPVYIGFGSMLWGAKRNTPLVLEAVRRWGGRAILCAGAGGLDEVTNAGPNVLVIKAVSHALLFPRMAGVVHHGGAGTTGEALRSGAPSIVLPVVADQLYWGRRVAALGAGPPPIPRGDVTPDRLADMLALIQRNPGYRAAARRISAALESEPGVDGAVEVIERILRGAEQPATVTGAASHWWSRPHFGAGASPLPRH